MMSILLAMFGAIPQGLVWGITGVGVFITFKILDFADMTCDGSFALGGCVSAMMMIGLGVDPFISLLAATCAGALAGAVTGLLHTKLKIPAILSGILTMLSLYSINLRIMGQSNQPIMTRTAGIDTIITLVVKALPASLQANKNINNFVLLGFGFIFVVIVITFLYWFFGTEAGSALRATGNNEAMIRALGVNTDNMKILGLTLGNALVGLSGALVAQSNAVADVNMGIGTIVIALASIVIGEVVFGKKLNFLLKLISVIVGTIIYRIIISLVLQMGLNTDDLKLFTAVIVAIALAIPAFAKPKINKGVKSC
jgi:putative ABC transport system permease protein